MVVYFKHVLLNHELSGRYSISLSTDARANVIIYDVIIVTSVVFHSTWKTITTTGYWYCCMCQHNIIDF